VADLYRMDEDGKGDVRLTQNGRNNKWPSWSPDGQQIAFISSEVGADPDTSATQLLVMGADGTGLGRLLVAHLVSRWFEAGLHLSSPNECRGRDCRRRWGRFMGRGLLRAGQPSLLAAVRRARGDCRRYLCAGGGSSRGRRMGDALPSQPMEGVTKKSSSSISPASLSSS